MIIRPIDSVGRIVLPKKFKEKLRLQNGDNVNVDIEGDRIIITNPKEADKIEELNNAILSVAETYNMEPNDVKVLLDLVNN